MSLPDEQDWEHDHLGEHLDQMLDLIQNSPDRARLEATSPQAKQAIFAVEKYVEKLQKGIEERADQPLSIADVKRLLQALDHLLFNDNIFDEAADIEIDFAWIADIQERKLGSAKVLSTMPPVLRVHAVFHKSGWEMIDTFLHEMAHLFLAQCRKAQGLLEAVCDAECARVMMKLFGKTGHAYYWQKLACAIEGRAFEIWRRRIDLGCITAMGHEWLASGVKPTKAYIDELYGTHIIPGRPRPEFALESMKKRQASIKTLRAEREAIQAGTARQEE